MIDERACLWVARLDRGLSAAERAALESWLAADGRHRGALLRAQAAMSLLDRGRALSGGEAEPEAGAGAGAIARPDRRAALRLGGGALAASLVAALGWRAWPRGRRITTAIGEIRHLPLDDGSVAVVNSGSRLVVAFRPERRAIALARGEAWFQVAHNRARPFVVRAGDAEIEAVGTAFDVRRDGDATEVTVTEGVVRITAPGAAPRLLAAGDQARIGADGVAIAALAPGASDRRLAWREGRIVLDDTSLAAAAAEFNRYHDDQLVVDERLAARRVVGWFQTDDLEGFARAGAAMVGGRVDRVPGGWRIVPKNSSPG
ncbi:FecR family protein [Sphingomonas morindae]|uniref:FecR domain-containing protein n=1 Tax=Sphingomonas morindae TaxID=1541170 RepID=A0ABY4XD59_9SPHN|nr:FecR domain-containing protein [Sphingomonas morindae]USI74774.1 FecR domain-containing protein [Sphingomonas morindae]